MSMTVGATVVVAMVNSTPGYSYMVMVMAEAVACIPVTVKEKVTV
jgi:hypothetical protein